ncbi:MAG: aminotransferase class I/II-fold pyridoxal phosphate-dependent enzyme, partial [Bacteroidota bacterium]
MQPIEQRLQAQLDHRKSINAFRTLPQPSARIDFCSNDYLGFARDSAELFQLSGAPTGATGSRLISGNAPAFERLERRLAHYFNAPAALLFNSGYSANIGLIACMATRHDTILYDQLAHASIREGLLLSPARTYNFRHNDLVHLEERLRKAQGNRFVIVESVYSMDGDQAPLQEMVDLCQHYQAALVVDEAHGTGVYGKKGEGVVVKLGLEE